MLELKREILPLTGLRGIAALLVVLAHYIIWYAPYQSRTEPQWSAPSSRPTSSA